jgi:uncharacterized protein
MDKLEKAQGLVAKILDSDNSGHGTDHVNRVMNLSLKFAKEEPANTEIVSLIALLHDVDDYKLFGTEAAENLTNAKKILDNCGFDEATKEQVVQAIKTIGYSKRLQGTSPTTIEGKIVSDADMCDGMGITGILRSFQYDIAHHRAFFDQNIYPNLDMSATEYKAKSDGTSVNHIFEKLLKLKDLMLTEPGRKEATKRHDFMVDFLYHFFEEEDAPEWAEYLENYLK